MVHCRQKQPRLQPPRDSGNIYSRVNSPTATRNNFGSQQYSRTGICRQHTEYGHKQHCIATRYRHQIRFCSNCHMHVRGRHGSRSGSLIIYLHTPCQTYSRRRKNNNRQIHHSTKHKTKRSTLQLVQIHCAEQGRLQPSQQLHTDT